MAWLILGVSWLVFGVVAWQQRQRLKTVTAKFQRFKDYVHGRLDEAGVPSDPGGPHSEQGCRVGDRLDIALRALPVLPEPQLVVLGKSSGVPAHWLAYLKAPDNAESVQEARARMAQTYSHWWEGFTQVAAKDYL